MKWTMSKDGKRRVDLRIAHRLSRDDLTGVLIAGIGAGSFGYDEDGNVTVLLEGKQVRQLSRVLTWKIIKDQLKYNASKGYYWQDDFRDYDVDEDFPGLGEVETWAREQVGRL